MNKTDYSRRKFLQTTGAALGGSMFVSSAGATIAASRKSGSGNKMRVALVGCGVRGLGMYGQRLMSGYGDHVEMVGVCDKNPGRAELAEQHIQPDGPSFTDLDEMLQQTNPDWLIVTTWDWTHHECIIKGMEHGANVICEKPLTMDADKARQIRDAERRTGRELIVTFNYRYAPLRSKIKELLMNGAIGDVHTADFHWNITHAHLNRYLMRWHGESDKGGTLWVHKSTHHFDLLNWWLDSDPVEVHALSRLHRFGPHGPFRGNNCRDCNYTDQCDYYWNILDSDWLTRVYVENEHYDGYIRDNCVYRNEIDIYEDHSCMVKYANNVVANYSLTADTDHSGFWLAFNGSEGRMEIREGGHKDRDFEEIVIHPRGGSPRVLAVPHQPGGHWGGDPILMNHLFVDQDRDDPLHLQAGSRDGVLSVAIGVAAHKSTEEQRVVRISELTDIDLQPVRPRV